MAAGAFLKTGAEAHRSNDQVDLRTRPSPTEAREGLLGSLPLAGTATDNLPIELVSKSSAGAKLHAFFDDFYNRVYLLPSSIQFGPISSTAQREVVVWNARLDPATLSTITITNGEGLTIDGEAVPYTFTPLELVTYTIEAGVDGPPILDADITFSLDSETVVLEVLGARAKVAPFEPNWRRPYVIEYQFKTDIFTSRTGKEQRRALRTTPRKTIAFEATPTFEQLRSFNGLMASWHNNTIVLPELPRRAVFAAALEAGEVTVELADDAPDWAVAGATVVLAYKGQYETHKISTAVGTQMTFTGPSLLDWPVGTKVHPGVSGRMATTIRSRRETNAVAVAQVELGVTPASEPVVPLPAAPTIFNGRELFAIKPNWVERPDVTYESHREDIDYDRGRMATFTPIDFSTQTRRMTFTGRTYEDTDLIREHFERMKGRRGEFYMPTFERDIQPGPLVPAGSNTIRIFGTAFAENYGNSTVFEAVMVQFADGAVQYNVVQDVFSVDDSDGQDSVIQVAVAWAQDISAENVRLACWMPVWRHASDTLTIEWLTNSVGQCQLTVQTLEDLA